MIDLIQPNSTVLVLNYDYSPINITNWKRAIVLLLKEKAQILSHSVIRLLNYVRIPIAKFIASKPSKNAIYCRDGYKCQYCSNTRNLTIDHIIPKSKGGGDNYSNLCVACSSCNAKKGDKLLEHTNMKLMRKPRAPRNKIEFFLLESNNREWRHYLNCIG